MATSSDSPALVIGGGPAGLMAADALLSAGVPVLLAEAKPSVGRKFLMAGKSGLNLTRAQPFGPFLAAYGGAEAALRPMLAEFTPETVQDWAAGLGQTTFAGSTGRVFPTAMKASPLLRAWLERLEGMGLDRRTRWRWTGWEGGAVCFDTPEGPQRLTPPVTVLALGGASWARLGSDGAWAGLLADEGIKVAPFQPANAGLCVDWSEHMAPHFGTPLKGIALAAGPLTSRGEAVISARGLEGGGLYPLSPALREGAPLHIDLAPDLSAGELAQRLGRPRGKQSLSNHLRKVLKLSPAARALLMECARPLPDDPARLAATVKALPVPHKGLRPMDEAISTAGGVPFAALDEALMLRARPGTYCAGEMLDWEAPTGGYLLTACLATGLWAGRHAALRALRA
ncbi:TIGR03862 family flavoprotein [Salipiger sp. HF18]|uniref:TIGR03862 family flavoprotein n=1 Tax=Salipiger sp. HF18 TaxID=2721557 RepID=UPI00142E8462|nr:TIGR03862 family flavoprotein [Salipiger sp. HF18]